jgi:hypothetical protein
MSADPAVIKVIESVASELTGKGEMFTAHMVTKAVRDKGHQLRHSDGKDAVHDLYARGEFGLAYTRTQINVGQGMPWLYHKSSDDPSTFTGVYGGGTPQVQSHSPSVSNAPSHPVSANKPTNDPSVIQIPSHYGTAVLPDDDDSDGDDDDGDSSLSALPRKVAIPSRPSFLSLPPVTAPASMMSRTPTTPTTGGNNGHVSQAGQKNGRRVDARKTLSLPTPLVRDHLKLSPGDKAYVVGRNDHIEVRKDYPSAVGSLSAYTVDCNNQIRITQATLKKAGIAGDSYDVEEEGDKIVVKLST